MKRTCTVLDQLRGFYLSALPVGRFAGAYDFAGKTVVILVLNKKVENLFIAPQVR